jgi:hypothetical protein
MPAETWKPVFLAAATENVGPLGWATWSGAQTFRLPKVYRAVASVRRLQVDGQRLAVCQPDALGERRQPCERVGVRPQEVRKCGDRVGESAGGAPRSGLPAIELQVIDVRAAG